MPRIIVQTEGTEANAPVVTFQERIVPSALTGDHFSAQLIERVGLAIADAEETERDRGETEPRRSRRGETVRGGGGSSTARRKHARARRTR